MNTKAIFAAVFIAMLATTAAYASPVSATTNPVNSSTPERNMAGVTIPSSLLYEVNGTLLAWVNASGHAIITTNMPQFRSYNLTVKQLYVAVRLSGQLSNINITTSSGVVNATLNLNARFVAKAEIYANSTVPFTANEDHTYSTSMPVTWVIPWGSTKNFTIPFASFSLDPTNPSVSPPSTIPIRFTDANDTVWSTSYTVDHVQWNFSTWLQNKIQSELNGIWAKALAGLQTANIPGFQGGFNVVRCNGYVDVWKTSGTTPDSILLMAGGLIDLLIDFSLVGHGSTSFYSDYLHMSVSVQYDVNFFVEFGLYFSLTVTSNWQIKTADSGGNYTLNEFMVQVPENATLVWRKVGVIIYYGSPAHGIDVTGGVSRSNATGAGQVLFFVDYGWDGTPDFATNGTGQPTQLTDHTGTISGTGGSRTVTLSKVSAGDWVYFKLTVPAGYVVTGVQKTDDGTTTTVNATQWYTTYGVLYVCDDPEYTYTVSLTSTSGAGGLQTSTLILIGALVAIAVVAALVLTRRKSGSKGVSIK